MKNYLKNEEMTQQNNIDTNLKAGLFNFYRFNLRLGVKK